MLVFSDNCNNGDTVRKVLTVGQLRDILKLYEDDEKIQLCNRNGQLREYNLIETDDNLMMKKILFTV